MLSLACFILITGRRIIFYVNVKGNRNLLPRGGVAPSAGHGGRANSKNAVLIVVNKGLKSNSEIFVKIVWKSLISAPPDI
ncbi:hypothetical protein B0909_24600 [Rhizobium rhizogenes]|nr:hypothetical protein B0909_24600 [Rhizobium rhizogenes]